jgi:thiol-disulfide isomerase/thioredoxin
MAIRALTVLLILCGAALVLVFAWRPRGVEGPPLTAPAGTAATQILGQFIARDTPSPAPALQFTTRGGATKQLADFKGQFVLINLWATWCGPCVKEMPTLARLQQKLGKDLTIIAISEDRQGDAAVAPFLAKHELGDLAIYLDPPTKASEAFKVEGLPTTVLVSPDGMILGQEAGGADWDSPAMMASLQKFIAAK